MGVDCRPRCDVVDVEVMARCGLQVRNDSQPETPEVVPRFSTAAPLKRTHVRLPHQSVRTNASTDEVERFDVAPKNHLA